MAKLFVSRYGDEYYAVIRTELQIIGNGYEYFRTKEEALAWADKYTAQSGSSRVTDDPPSGRDGWMHPDGPPDEVMPFYWFVPDPKPSTSEESI